MRPGRSGDSSRRCAFLTGVKTTLGGTNIAGFAGETACTNMAPWTGLQDAFRVIVRMDH